MGRINAQHVGTEHLAINNTTTRRVITLLALRVATTCFRRKGSVVQLSEHFIVKKGLSVHLTEATTMRFVAEHTSLPVPRVYCSFVHKNRAYIVMERIKGKTIAEAWPELSTESRRRVLKQLKDMVDELRSVKPTSPARVESCANGSLRGSRIAHCIPRMGPFETIQEFHLWLRKGLLQPDPKQEVDDEWLEIASMIERQDGAWPPTVLTHGDLNPFNILVQGDKVVGLIDWECSGWYPYYWEYTSAWYGNLTREAWQDELAQFLVPYPEDLEMERIRERWWGEI